MELFTGFIPANNFKLERPSMEKLNFKNLDGVFGMF